MKEEKSLGLEKKIKNMEPKKKKLFNNILSIGIIFSCIYGLLSFIMTYTRTHSLMKYFSTGEFITVVILLVFCGLGYKILNGGTFHVPDEFSKKKQTQKQQFNMPNVWGVQSMSKKERTSKTKPESVAKRKRIKVKRKKPQQQGAWKCPNCGEFTVGNQCRSCGYSR